MSTISTSKQVIRAALQNGPLTTRSLHLSLHSQNALLPSRPTPRNFLAGIGRSSKSSKAAVQEAEESPNGVWSMSYLKKVILKDMEARKEVIKLTRGKYERVAAVSSTTSGPIASTSTEGLSPAGIKAATANLLKYNDEHIWFLSDAWIKLLEQSKERKALAVGSQS